DDTSVGAAWRYAIANLNPFVVEPTGSTALEQYEEERYQLFDGEENPNGLTAQYLSDRAAFLFWKITQNNANLPSSPLAYSDAVLYDDYATHYRAYVLPTFVPKAEKVEKEFERFNSLGQGRNVIFV